MLDRRASFDRRTQISTFTLNNLLDSVLASAPELRKFVTFGTAEAVPVQEGCQVDETITVASGCRFCGSVVDGGCVRTGSGRHDYLDV